MTVDPLGWPSIPAPPDPLPDAVGGALREARITLWRDLWQRVECFDRWRREDAELVERIAALVEELPANAKRRRLRARVAALRADVQSRSSSPHDEGNT